MSESKTLLSCGTIVGVFTIIGAIAAVVSALRETPPPQPTSIPQQPSNTKPPFTEPPSTSPTIPNNSSSAPIPSPEVKREKPREIQPKKSPSYSITEVLGGVEFHVEQINRRGKFVSIVLKVTSLNRDSKVVFDDYQDTNIVLANGSRVTRSRIEFGPDQFPIARLSAGVTENAVLEFENVPPDSDIIFLDVDVNANFNRRVKFHLPPHNLQTLSVGLPR